MSLTVDLDVLNEVREVTDEEVRFYETHGWVMLRGLYSRRLTAELLRVCKTLVEEGDSGLQGLRQRRPLARAGLEPFPTLAFGPRMGRAAQRLINRARLTDAEVPIRYLDDLVWCKEPGALPIAYHQDSSYEGVDRTGRINFWIALDEVRPEMGAMRFFSGSHREGPLGVHEFVEDEQQRDPMLTSYPKLSDLYQLSSPFHYQPGDATAHHGWMIHGSPRNQTDRQRWCYIAEYTPADARYLQGKYHGSGELGKPLADDAYPIVHPARSA